MEELKNLASKIDDVKDKLTDAEYKDLMELSQKFYDKEEEKKAGKKFMKVMCITSTMILDLTAKTEGDGCDCGNPDCAARRGGADADEETIDLIDPDETLTGINYRYDNCSDEYNGELKQLRFKGIVKQSQQIILFEIRTRSAIEGFCIDMENCRMTEYAYDSLMKNKYMVDEGHQATPLATFVYLSHYEI
jgi:hypothetical protein